MAEIRKLWVLAGSSPRGGERERATVQDGERQLARFAGDQVRRMPLGSWLAAQLSWISVGDSATPRTFEPLRIASYVYAPHRPGIAHHFARPSIQEAEVGLHLTEPGSDLWRERLAFRHALRLDLGLAAEYAALLAASTAATSGRTPTASAPSSAACWPRRGSGSAGGSAGAPLSPTAGAPSRSPRTASAAPTPR
jgi:hypothetical protein